MLSRYVDGAKAVSEEADGLKLQPVALSCMLNIGACKLKMSDWQGAVDSCLEVSLFDFLKELDCDLSLRTEVVLCDTGISYFIEHNETQ